MTLRQMVARLAEAGFDAVLLELPRPPYETYVCRVVCPGLEVEPSALTGRRLAAAIAATGGGAWSTQEGSP